MNARTAIIRAMTFLGGLYFVVYFLAPESALAKVGIKDAHEYISYGFVLIGAVAFGVGLINLVLIHGTAILRARSGWGFSAALLFGLAAMMYLSARDWASDLEIASTRRNIEMLASFGDRIAADAAGQPAATVEERQRLLGKAVKDQLSALDVACTAGSDGCGEFTAVRGELSSLLPSVLSAQGAVRNGELSSKLRIFGAKTSVVLSARKAIDINTRLFTVLNEGFFIALGSSMFALLAFYITSAAFRAFRVKNAESALLMLASIIVMLGQIPLGVELWDGFPHLRLWLLEWPNSAAFRAISMGALVAGFVMSIRLWLSIGTESEHE